MNEKWNRELLNDYMKKWLNKRMNEWLNERVKEDNEWKENE